MESLHRDRAGRAALGAETAADADRLVLEDGGGPSGRDATELSLEHSVQPGGPIDPVDRDDPQTELGADVDAAAAEDALVAVEDRVHAAVEAATRLAAGALLVEALLDRRALRSQSLSPTGQVGMATRFRAS